MRRSRVAIPHVCFETTILTQPPLDQPPDRLGTGGSGMGLPLDPGGDLRLQLDGDADALRRGLAGPGAAARSFFEIGY